MLLLLLLGLLLLDADLVLHCRGADGCHLLLLLLLLLLLTQLLLLLLLELQPVICCGMRA